MNQVHQAGDGAPSPFSPTFGVNPPLIAGRQPVVAALADAFDSGPGGAGRASLLTGNRGTGKTVMLNEAEAQAIERGWLVISETATRGLLDRLTTEALPRLADKLRQAPRERTRIAGVTLPAGLGGIDLDLPAPYTPGGFRTQLEALTDALAERGTGVLITIDEVHSKAARDDIDVLCAVIQHAFREGRDVVFVTAGLPAAVQDLLSSDVSTFLRRARRLVLGPISIDLAQDAIRVPIEAAGRQIAAEDARYAADASFGYPYLTQVIGDQIWRQNPSSERITRRHVRDGVVAGVGEFSVAVHEPAFNDLSEMDREFVKAMAVDLRESKTGDIATRLGKTTSYIAPYRNRLWVAGIIEPSRYGYVRFAIPYLREFVKWNEDRF